MRNKYFISLLFTSLFTLVFSQSMQNEGDLGKNNQQFQKGQVELPDWVDPETGIDQTTNQPYVKIPYKPVEKAAIVSPALNKPLPAWADQILIIEYGSYNDEFIRSAAEAAGHVVTTASSLPSDVSSYDQIWDYGRFFAALSSSDMTKLKTVLENGGTVYLTGERSCCPNRNNSIVSFIQDVGGGDDVAIATSDAGSSSNILQSDFRTPNNITDVQYGSSGYFSNIGNGTAITKTDYSPSQITAATWNDLSAPYTGKIIAVLDVNIWTDNYINDSDNVKYLENIVALAETAQPPTGSSADLAADNTYIDITMSTAVYNATGGSGALEATDFTLTFAQNSGSATAASISSVKQNDNTAEASATALAGGETVIRIFLSITGTPSGVETITITPVDGSSIYDASDRAMESSQTTGAIALNDKLAPTISSVSLAANNAGIILTVSDPLYNTNGGSGDLEVSDFVFSISGGTATLSSTTPTEISNTESPPWLYTLSISLSGTADGTEVLTVNPVDDGIYDAAGNEMSTSQSNNTATLNDVTGPTITSVSSTTANGTYGIDDEIAITITFSETVIVNSDLFEQDGTGRPRLTLETGSSDHATNYTSGSGGATLTWNYTVQSGNISSDLDYKSLALNGGTIKDATGNDADLTTLPSPGASGSLAANKALVVDGVVPTIYSAAVASNNSYIDITMSEAVYNANAGSGALEATDFTLTFVQNSGNATAASISSVKQNDSATEGSATALAGGEIVIRAFLSFTGTPSGVETITITPVNAASIYDVAGNAMAASQTTGAKTANDQLLPTITSVSLAANNSTIAVTLSESVYNTNDGSGALEASDFAFSISGGTATLSSATPSGLSPNGNVYTLDIDLSGTPNGAEVLTVNPVDDSIYDATGNEASTSQSNNTATLNDQAGPTISSVSLASNNSSIAVTFSEAVYNATGGSGALEASDFSFSIIGGTATLASATPSSISPNGNVYTLGISLSGTPNGSEVLTVNPMDDSIYDSDGNEASMSQSNNTATLNDDIFPIITSVSLAANNSTLAVTFSEAVYNATGGSGALEASDFVFSTTLGTATLSSTAPTSISISGNVYTLGIGLSGNPDGDEVLVVNPVDDSIYDAAGNEASTSQSNNTVELNEKIVPIISSVALASDNSTLAVTFSEAVYNATGGSGALEVGDFAFSITGGTATLTSTTPSSISISGNVYTLGITLTGTPDGSEVLRVNPKDDSIYDAQNNEASTSQSNNTATLNDNTVPTVTSVSSVTANGTYSIGSVVQVNTVFSEEVVVTGTPQITFETGTTDRTVNYASGSGTNTLTFNYTVASGDTTSDLDYTAATSLALNSGTIKDAAGNVATLTLPSPGAVYSLGANKALVIDGNAPTVSSVTSAKTNGAYSVNDTIPISVTFTQTVAVTGTPQLTVETGATDGVANYISGSGATITFDYIVASGHTSGDLDYTSAAALTLNSGTIKDASGNAATLTLPAPAANNSLGDSKALIIDTTGPTVTSVSSTTDNGAYNAGDTINVSVTFSENTVVTGTPQITMETGTVDGTGNYVSGTGTTVLSFDYIVASGHHSADLDYENTSALILNAGTLKDAQGNNATLTLASPGATNSLGASKAILIDTAVPLIHLAAEGGILGIDDKDYQSASTTLDISWSGSDSLSGIYKFEYALGTTSGGTETISWTDASTNPDLLASTSVSLTGQTLSDATKYYLSVRATDKAGNLSAVKTGDGITIDVTAPKAGTVHDGTGADIAYTSAANTLSGNWTGFSDVTSGITDYQYAIGTTSGGIDVKGWTSNTTDTSFTFTGYNLTNAQAYYLSVKAIDMVGHVSDTVTSNGAIADLDAPTKGIVIDGLTADRALTNTDTIYASWSGFADTLSGLSKYQYAVGRSIGASDVVDWADNGLDTSITIKPSMDDANSYYVSVRAVDHVNNTSSVSTSDGVTADFLPPSIIAVSIEEWSTLPILSNATITYTTSEPITAATANVVSYAGDKLTDTLSVEKELSTNLSNRITVDLTAPFTSGDELAVKINGITDMAGNVTNDLVYLYNIALLGDYDLDGDIGVTDLATFTGGWAAGDLTLELGPTIGAAPNLKPIPDGKYTARDMMAFTRMWHWNTSKLGKVGAKVLANQGKALNAVIENDHIVFNPPRGTRAVELILDYPATDIQFSIAADQQVTAEEGLTLSNVDTLNGSLVYQAGYFEVNNKPVRINTKHLQKNDVAVNLSYQFIGDDNIVLSAGSEALELTPVPKEFSLHQNYPNPFNPVTTINYDLPKDGYVNLVIYDILGREVVNLVGKDMSAGYQTVIWNTRNQFGSPVAAGIYFYQIQTRDFMKTKKMVLLK